MPSFRFHILFQGWQIWQSESLWVCTEGKTIENHQHDRTASPKSLRCFYSPSSSKPLNFFFSWLLIPCTVGFQVDRCLTSSSCPTLQYQMQTERQRIRSEFNQLRCILDCEERRELQKLEEEERKTLDNLAAAEAELVQQTWLLKDLISDLECRREWPTQELLQVRRTTWSEMLNTQPELLSRRCPGALIHC